MRPNLSWLVRDNPDYDPNQISAISTAAIIHALVAAGKAVLLPCVHVKPYDLVIEEEGGRFFRVQCKTGRLIRGAIYFRPHRLRAAKRETGWVRRVTSYEGQVDFFGVYCPENQGVYLVPITDIPANRSCSLRLTPAKNNQNKRIHWAKDYAVTPLPIVPPSSEDLFPQPDFLGP
jgi:hypothetical protein